MVGWFPRLGTKCSKILEFPNNRQNVSGDAVGSMEERFDLIMKNDTRSEMKNYLDQNSTKT